MDERLKQLVEMGTISQSLADKAAVSKVEFPGNKDILKGAVEGSVFGEIQGDVHKVSISQNGLSCDCAYATKRGGICSHIVSMAYNVQGGLELLIKTPIIKSNSEKKELEKTEAVGILSAVGKEFTKYGNINRILYLATPDGEQRVTMIASSIDEMTGLIGSIKQGDKIKATITRTERGFVSSRDPIVVLEAGKVIEKQETAVPSKEQAMTHVDEVKEGELTLVELMKIDNMDESLIVKETVMGTEPLVYEIPRYKCDKCGKVTGKAQCNTCKKQLGPECYMPTHRLSWAGLCEAMRQYGNLHALDFGITPMGGVEVAWVRMKDEKRNIILAGFCERFSQPYFKYTTLLSKAQRNCIHRLVPKTILDDVVVMAKNAKNIMILSPEGNGL